MFIKEKGSFFYVKNMKTKNTEREKRKKRAQVCRQGCQMLSKKERRRENEERKKKRTTDRICHG
jgi:hypothetical protein